MSLDDFGEKNGAAEGTRTPDPIITNDVLYQLSYSGILLVQGFGPLDRAGKTAPCDALRGLLASRAGHS
jgi:hypothetical protein